VHASAITVGLHYPKLKMRSWKFFRRCCIFDLGSDGDYGLDVCYHSHTHDLVSTDDYAKEDYRCFCALPWYFVSFYPPLCSGCHPSLTHSSASIATLIRVKYLIELSDTSDILFTGTTAMVWTLIEPGLAITAASLITIRPLLRALNFKGFGSTDNNTSRYITSHNNLSRSMGQQNFSQRRDEFAMANWNALSSVTGPEEAGVKGVSKGGLKVRSEPVSDAESEQHILQGEATGDLEDGKIRRTRTVTVVINPQLRSDSKS
jgi:hypothetical protein